jgi:hypothetical protein
MSRIKPFKLVIGSTQSPEINKIATNNYDQENTIEYEGNNNYMINAAQKRKLLSKNALDKNKISPSNKSIVKPSILNQPNIKAVKQQKKAIRDKRRREITNDIEDMDLSNNNITHEESNNNSESVRATNFDKPQPNTPNENNYQDNNSNTIPEKVKTKGKRNMTEIQMLKPENKFNILEEANNLYPKISLTQLLSASPSIRKDLEQGCKPRVEKILYTIQNLNIPILCGKIGNKSVKILFDTGANVNIITKNSLEELENVIINNCDLSETITIADGTIFHTNSYINLKLTINNNLTVNEKFYIIDYTNPFFNIILGRGIQKKYRLYIDPDDDCLYQKTKKGIKRITEIYNNHTSLKTPMCNAIIIEKNKGIGSTLLQKEEDKLEHPTCCLSRTLSINYNKPIKSITDYKPLLGLLKKNIPNNNRHARWIEEFNKYKTNLVYQKRKRNLFDDALSRLSSKDSEAIL